MSSIPIWLRVWPMKKSTKFVMEIESLVQNSGQILLTTKFSAFTLDIQTGILWAFDIKITRFKSPKFIYTCRATTFMKDKKWDKFVLNNRIATKLGWKPFRGKILCFNARFQTGISWASDIKIKQFKSPNSYTCPGLQLLWRIQSEIKKF